jgi:hypothetical protein
VGQENVSSLPAGRQAPKHNKYAERVRLESARESGGNAVQKPFGGGKAKAEAERTEPRNQYHQERSWSSADDFQEWFANHLTLPRAETPSVVSDKEERGLRSL